MYSNPKTHPRKQKQKQKTKCLAQTVQYQVTISLTVTLPHGRKHGDDVQPRISGKVYKQDLTWHQWGIS